MPDGQSLKIFLPVLLVVAVTFVGFVKMAIERAGAVKQGQNPEFYKVYLGDPEPEKTRAAVRHWDNLFELPTVFYAGCLTAYVLGAVSITVLVCAWIFAVGRAVQSFIHLTYNSPNHRGGAFTLSFLGLMVMWGALAAHIVAAV
ncbi:MAPEG family protein [Novosphingobium sp.]|uniref:MAPEG family protein n=1 Tax=Novosphingobium sp. TaxID=1874826 RepID=UPI00286DDFD5|nr:MAPEG family protein [Novosphingobium sp.]